MRFWKRLFFSKRLQDQARELAADFARACPPPDRLGKQIISEQRVQAALRTLYTAVSAVSREQGLGVLRRAMLGRAFQQEMIKLGYAPSLVSRVMGSLTINALVKR